jgi:hypothetical protein
MKVSKVDRLIDLALNGTLEYDQGDNKEQFHKLGKQVCKLIAQRLGLQKSQYNISSNKAGIAVSGEITLHADNIYIQLGRSALLKDLCIDIAKAKRIIRVARIVGWNGKICLTWTARLPSLKNVKNKCDKLTGRVSGLFSMT